MTLGGMGMAGHFQPIKKLNMWDSITQLCKTGTSKSMNRSLCIKLCLWLYNNIGSLRPVICCTFTAEPCCSCCDQTCSLGASWSKQTAAVWHEPAPCFVPWPQSVPSAFLSPPTPKFPPTWGVVNVDDSASSASTGGVDRDSPDTAVSIWTAGRAEAGWGSDSDTD